MYQKRKEIIKEILETEQRYVADLNICVTIWLNPLKQKKLLKEPDINKIFSIIENILKFHKTFLELLEERLKQEVTTKTCIADIFVKNVRIIFPHFFWGD